MKTLGLILIFIPFFHTLAQSLPPAARVACELQKTSNSKMTFPRSDANETIYPYIYNLKDQNNESFKSILSQQIVYSTDDVIIVFIAAQDSEDKLGIYRVEINNALKSVKTQFLNAIPDKLKEIKESYSSEIPFTLFAFNKGLLLYPGNDAGVWKLINLTNGGLVHQWNHPIGFYNPQIKDKYVSWTAKDSDKAQLFLHDLKNDNSRIITTKTDIQFLNFYQNSLYYLEIAKLESKKTYRVLSISPTATKLVFELDAANADYTNFLMVNNAIFYTSEKLFNTKLPASVMEAQVNVFDASKNAISQKVKYAIFMVELLKKYGTPQFRLISNPMWYQNELIFTLNSVGGMVKFNFSRKQWFYIGYPYEGNTCFNPTFININSSGL